MFNMANLKREDIQELLKEMIVTHDHGRLNLQYEDIDKNATLISDLGFDSLDVVELSSNIENKLKIQLNESDVERIMMRETIDSLADFLFSRYQETHQDEQLQ